MMTESRRRWVLVVAAFVANVGAAVAAWFLPGGWAVCALVFVAVPLVAVLWVARSRRRELAAVDARHAAEFAETVARLRPAGEGGR